MGEWEKLYPDDWKERYRDAIVSAKTAVSKIRNGNQIFIGTGCGEPQHLIRALLSTDDLFDVDFYQLLPFTLSNFLGEPHFLDRFHFNAFFITDRTRQAAFEGKINYIPTYLSEIPSLFQRQIGVDVALIQVTPPDEFGYCSLGISVDVTKRAAEAAQFTIAQVNSYMPRTLGNSFVHVSKIDCLVPYDEPLIEVSLPEADEVIRRIAHYVSRLIEDGSTLEVGIGRLPAPVLPFLRRKKDLGIHTEMLSDAYLDLISEGVITNEKKTLHSGKIITSFCMGTRRLYRFVHDNPMVEFHPSDYVNDPLIISQNDKMVAINAALEIDLTGQICSDSMGYLFYSGIGGQADFLRGAARSKGGVPIIVMPSTAKGGTVSRIVPHLSEGAGVVVTRGGAHFVVTEYGIGYLKGRNIYQRVMELINLAHPTYREGLLDAAKQRRYIFEDQIPPSEKDLIYLEKLEHTMTLKDGTKVLFRPIRPTDEFAFRNFIYSFSEESLYNRFFQVIKVWPHPEAQRWVNIDYEKAMTEVGVITEGGLQRIIALGQYGEDEDEEGCVELALLVHEDCRKQGIGAFLLKLIIGLAEKNGYTKIGLTVLWNNKAMLHLLKKIYPELKLENAGGGILKGRAEL